MNNIELPKLNTQNKYNQVQNNENIPNITPNKDNPTSKLPKELPPQTLKSTLKEVKIFLKDSDSFELLKFISELFLLAIFIILIKLPFNLIIELGGNIFRVLDINVTVIALDFWRNIFNVCYAVVGLILYEYIFVSRFYNINIKYHKKNNKMEDSQSK